MYSVLCQFSLYTLNYLYVNIHKKLRKKHKLAVNVKLALSMNDGMSRFRFSVYNFCFQRDESLTCIQNILILYTLSVAEKIHSSPRNELFVYKDFQYVSEPWLSSFVNKHKHQSRHTMAIPHINNFLKFDQ